MTRTLALLASALILTPQLASAAAVSWSGAASDKLWSNAGNWSAKPTSADDVSFGNADTTIATSGPTGVSNSIVDVGFANAIKSLRFTNTSGFHNIRITNNITITGSGTANSLFVGTDMVGPNMPQGVYATVSGPAALTVTNTTGYLRVVQGTNASGGSSTLTRATLDLSGLDTFSARVLGYYLAVAADSTESAKWNRPNATVLLARTNYLTCTTHLLSEAYNNNGNTSLERLGQVNYFNVDSFQVGERKGRATLDFNSVWPDPTARFRNTAGTGRSSWVIGTDSGATGSGATISTVDFSRGTVDALVSTMYVGQSQGYANLTETGDGTGTLTLGAGIIDVTTVELGYQIGNGTQGGESTGKGTINILTNGVLKVGSNLRLTRQLSPVSGAVDRCSAALIINNGTVTVGGNVVDGGGTTSIVITNNGILNLQPSGDATPGAVTVKSLTIGEASVTNYSTLTTASITVSEPATEFVVYPGEALVPVATGVAGSLSVNGSLRLTNATVKSDLGDIGTYDQVAVSNGLTLQGTNTLDINPIGAPSTGVNYTLMTYGSGLDGGTNNLVLSDLIRMSRYNPALDINTFGQVNLILNGSPANLTWSGGLNDNAWDVANTVNFNYDPVGGTNTEKFYSLDHVTFDGSSTNPSVNLVGTLVPGSITVNSSYNFGGSGTIGGAPAVTVNSSGSLALATTNDFGSSGCTLLNAGGTLIFSPPAGTQNVAGVISGYGTLAKEGPGTTVLGGANTFSSDLTIAGGMVIAGSTTALGDTSGNTTVTSGGTLDINGVNFSTEQVYVSGAGVGGKGAVVNNGVGQGDALALITMTGDTTFGGSGGRMDINNVSGTPGGLVSSPAGFKLTKVGGNALSLFNNYGLTAGAANLFDSQLGDIEVKEGVLRIQCGTVLGDPTKTITVRSNATFQLDNLWAANIVNKVVVLDDGACMYGTRGAAYDYFGGPITLNGLNTFDVISTAYLILTNEISGTGSLVKNIGYHPGSPETSTGAGTLILSASNSFTGDFKLQTGTTILTNDASVTKAANIWMAGGTLTLLRTDATLALATGQTFKGNGTLNGKLNSPTNTTVSPGTTTTAATLTLKGDTTLRGTTLMDITKSGASLTADKLAVTGTLDLGGTLTVSLAGTTALAAGDKFTLFTATGGFLTGFTTVDLPGGPSVVWTNKTAIDGTIEVLSAEPTTPPVLTNTVTGGNQLALSWSMAYSSYLLQGQTNPVTGLRTNVAAWGLVPGVSGNQVTIPIDPANGSVFFRLLHQ